MHVRSSRRVSGSSSVQVRPVRKELTERLMGGALAPALFASALLCMSREKQSSVMQRLVAQAALNGHIRRTYVTHLEAMACVLSPRGMALAAHSYQARASATLHACTCTCARVRGMPAPARAYEPCARRPALP
jgi:hypothetical protein